MPIESDIQKLKIYVVNKIKELLDYQFAYIDSHRFVALRDAVCTRLILFNGRRGGEVNNFTITKLPKLYQFYILSLPCLNGSF